MGRISTFIARWILPVIVPLIAVLIGTLLRENISSGDTTGIVINSLGILFLVIASIFNTMTNRNLGRISAYKEDMEILNRVEGRLKKEIESEKQP